MANPTSYAVYAPTLIRLAVAITFLVHGIDILTHTEQTIAFFTKVGIPSPIVMAVVVGLIETIGGIALLLGVGTTIVSLIFSALMLLTMIVVKFKMGFIGGYELDFILLLASLSLVVSGPGALALQLKGK